MYKSGTPKVSQDTPKVSHFMKLKCKTIVFLSKHYSRRKIITYFTRNNLINWLYNLGRPGRTLDTILYNFHTIEKIYAELYENCIIVPRFIHCFHCIYCTTTYRFNTLVLYILHKNNGNCVALNIKYTTSQTIVFTRFVAVAWRKPKKSLVWT